MRLILVFVVLLFGFISRAHATATFVVTSIVSEGGFTRISYTLSGWSLEDSGLSACGGTNRNCQVRPELRLVGSQNSGDQWSVTTALNRPVTFGDILRELNSMGVFMPYSDSYLIESAADLTGGCMVYTTSSGNMGGPAYDLTNCVPLRPPTPPVQCSISGNATVDHRALSGSELNGAQASTRLNVRCNASASISVRAARTNTWGVRLRNDDSLYSVVTINTRDATNGINMSVTNNLDSPLNIISTLVTRGAVAPGPFSGSTVITVSPN